MDITKIEIQIKRYLPINSKKKKKSPKLLYTNIIWIANDKQYFWPQVFMMKASVRLTN